MAGTPCSVCGDVLPEGLLYDPEAAQRCALARRRSLGRRLAVSGAASPWQVGARFLRYFAALSCPVLVVSALGRTATGSGALARCPCARCALLSAAASAVLTRGVDAGGKRTVPGAVNAWIREYAARHADMAFCDTRAAVAAPGSPDRLLSSPDDLHPSADGYRRMALALAPAIEELSERRGWRGGGRR